MLIEGEIYDAFTRGDFIENDETIEVIGTEGVTLRVKKVWQPHPPLTSALSPQERGVSIWFWFILIFFICHFQKYFSNFYFTAK